MRSSLDDSAPAPRDCRAMRRPGGCVHTVATLRERRVPTNRVLTGRQLDELHDEAPWHAAEKTDLFVEVDPNQKERVILSLKKMGHVLGFLGDGVNDAPAMHAADTSLSVEQAVDVAREAADFVLLERGLDVIRRGIEEGRKPVANTLTYLHRENGSMTATHIGASDDDHGRPVRGSHVSYVTIHP